HTTLYIFSSLSYLSPRHLPSFPTRRSSDLRLPPSRCHRSAGETGLPLCPDNRPHNSVRRANDTSTTEWRGRADNRNRQKAWLWQDRKSTRLNSSHGSISYAVFCLKKKKSKK